MDKINLKKLAEALKLSPSSVSRALRDSHEISKETKARVKELAERLGFQPNPHASSLRQQKSKTIAVIIPEVHNNFFAQVINGVEEVANAKGYHVLIYLSHEDQQRENEILNLLRNGRVDGIMISVSNKTKNSAQLEACKESGMPLVFFDRVYEDVIAPWVISDDEEAAFRATELLIKKGCKKICLITPPQNLSISKRRKSGYERAMVKFNLGEFISILECGYNDTEDRTKIKDLLLGDNKPDALFPVIERFAIDTYEVCRDIHIQIPKELKVISFSNLAAATLFNPPLSTIIQPAYEMGRRATDILFKLVDNKTLLQLEKKVTLSSQIIERKSTQ